MQRKCRPFPVQGNTNPVAPTEHAYVCKGRGLHLSQLNSEKHPQCPGTEEGGSSPTTPPPHTHTHSQSQGESAATDRLCTPHCNNPAQDRFLHTASKAQEIQGRSRWASTYKGRTQLEAGPWDTTHNCEQAFCFSSPCVYSISHQVGQSKSQTAPSIEMGGCSGEAP